MESSGQTAACHHPNPRTHHLDTGHKGPRNERGPKEAWSEQRSGRRVGRYSRGIVVRCASNYTRTKVREEPSDGVLRMSRWILRHRGDVTESPLSGKRMPNKQLKSIRGCGRHPLQSRPSLHSIFPPGLAVKAER